MNCFPIPTINFKLTAAEANGQLFISIVRISHGNRPTTVFLNMRE